MNRQHTRWGSTQTVVNAVNQNKVILNRGLYRLAASHKVVIRGLIDSIQDLTAYVNKVRSRIKYGMTLLYNNNRCVEAPRLQPLGITALLHNNQEAGDPRWNSSGMIPHFINGRCTDRGFILRPSSSRSVGVRDIGAACEALNKNAFRAPLRSGFTLIELLVVVLIIGILAAVALPQYQKAVEKSKAAQAMQLLRLVFAAYESYYLENGTYARNFAALPIDIPWADRPDLLTPDISTAPRDLKANDDWSIHIDDDGVLAGIIVRSLSRKYTGAWFVIWSKYDAPYLPTHKMLCAEHISKIKEEGSYCAKLFQGKKIFTTTKTRYYELPF